MDNVKVSLPKPEDTTGVKIKGFLRQLELCIHHLQKSVEEMEKEGELSENTYVIYRFPYLEKMEGKDSHINIHIDDLSETFKGQNIEIEIATV